MGSVLDDDFDQGPKLRKSFPVFRTQFNKYEELPSPLAFQPVDGKHYLLHNLIFPFVNLSAMLQKLTF